MKSEGFAVRISNVFVFSPFFFSFSFFSFFFFLSRVRLWVRVKALSVLMLCAPSNRQRPFLYSIFLFFSVFS